MKLEIIVCAGMLTLALTACSPAPICDRDAQSWNKFDTAQDDCDVVVVERSNMRELYRDRPKRDKKPPTVIPPAVLPPECDPVVRAKNNSDCRTHCGYFGDECN